MERTKLIGFLLIAAIILGMSIYNAPSKEELAEHQRVRDSIEQAQDGIAEKMDQDIIASSDDSSSVLSDTSSTAVVATSRKAESIETISNDVFALSFSNQGGQLRGVELKEHYQWATDDTEYKAKVPVKLLDHPDNQWEFIVNDSGRELRTGSLTFTPSRQSDGISYRSDLGGGKAIVQTYKISPGSYLIDYEVDLQGMSNQEAQFYWNNFLKPIEKNDRYERTMYSALYYQELDNDVDYTGMRRSKDISLDDEKLKWISGAQQFFNTTLIADDYLVGTRTETILAEEDTDLLKEQRTWLSVPLDGSKFQAQIYSGPNDFEELKEIGYDLQEVVPFGWGIFGSINRWIVRPLFNLLLGLFSSKGLVIIVLTLLVKVILYPLTYKMLHSQAKMAALKPQLAGLKEKHEGDSQKVQMETMKVYREYGVNPLGGCLPMVAQMPIWIALYRFFPASIEFRQSSFLWSRDLSSYDAFFQLPFELPLGMGSHLSLFTLLWAVTTVIYTYYNTKHMDMTANPAMKWMQYLMPIMFLGFFNSYASGLTCYLLFSNIFNITQTIGTKQLIFNDKKILAELNAKKEKPKKKGGFQDRLQKALAEQQRIAAEKAKNKGK